MTAITIRKRDFVDARTPRSWLGGIAMLAGDGRRSINRSQTVLAFKYAAGAPGVAAMNATSLLAADTRRKTLVWQEFEIFAAERLALPCGEVPEGHFESASGHRVEFVDGAGKTVGRQPFCKRIGLKKGSIDLLGLCGHDAMKTDGVGQLDPRFVV
jgi:hypothetical protein